ncbi:hypothetical protein SBDP1_30001 [Syntrophobacter sp. SbD1]|nr:hypothetical protein SBDP1_30001 [Syntrophobacter sp. SbD1]
MGIWEKAENAARRGVERLEWDEQVKLRSTWLQVQPQAEKFCFSVRSLTGVSEQRLAIRLIPLYIQ